ncbi:unnamed protein product [Tuber melanosporum]|uniref:(Perigord truffle) hypothetical protein n=1 Tax=Tuber melanosporum (strain Mel28) TaxID=656061 RepID=D5GDY1_TUBMM|nr:unnamed protein product [Tuber melanosporum]
MFILLINQKSKEHYILFLPYFQL